MFNSLFRSRSGWVLPILLLLLVGGCGDFFAQKPTELQTQVILNELQQIEENPHVKNPLPELYRQPAKKLEVDDGVKLFYFTKHHPASELAELVNTQFSKLFKTAKSKQQPDGKEYPKPTYSVSPSAATNQLIVHCPNNQQADKVLAFLNNVDVPPIQVNVDCLILERFADVTMDWETSIEIDNLFGERITLGGKKDSEGNLLAAFPGASLREPKRATFGLDFGYWNQKLAPHEFRAVVDILISRGYLRVLSNPKLETINGRKATITARDFAPLEKILSKEGFDEPFNLTDYQWVEDTLEVTPHVFSDGSIGLETYVMLGSRSKPEGVVQTSIITERFVRVEENRIEPGRSLIIGGLRKSEERSVVRGVPMLKDIPVLGVFFSSKDFEEKATEVTFILTPSISSGGVEYTEMIEMIREKRAKPTQEAGLQEALTDPFGSDAYTEHMELRAAQAEFERLKAEIEKAEAQEEVNRIKQELLKQAQDIVAEKTKAKRAQSEARLAKEEAEKAKAEIDKVRIEVEKIKAEIERTKAAAKEAQAEARKAQAESEKLKAEGERAKSGAEEVKAEKPEITGEKPKIKAEKDAEETQKNKAKA